MTPLSEFVKRGLKNQYMPDQECWSYIYHLDGRANPNESVPYFDTFYSLNVILGFAALGPQAWQDQYDLPKLLHINARRMFEHTVPTYAYGMALWASAQLNEPLQKNVMDKIVAFVKDRSKWNSYRAQDTGMILTGIAEQSARGNHVLDAEAHALFEHIKKNYRAASELYFDQPTGFRRNFASFATQTYLTTALYHYGTRFNNDEALKLVDGSVKKLMSLQGPMGEWPWFYYPAKGIVVDNYEVYSVHQDGMAPLFLTFAEQRGIAGAREAIIKGFEWMHGKNQMNKNMLVPELGMFIRSQIRKGELTDKKKRMLRAVVNGAMGRSDPYADPSRLTLRLECRSYHLGWVLYSFGNRQDLPMITHHNDFVNANQQIAKAV